MRKKDLRLIVTLLLALLLAFGAIVTTQSNQVYAASVKTLLAKTIVRSIDTQTFAPALPTILFSLITPLIFDKLDEVTMFPASFSLFLLAFCRVTMGLVFIVSSMSKVLNIAQFQQSIRQFRILPSSMSGGVALLFLGGEFAVVILMIIGGRLLLPGFGLAVFLLLLFCLALVSVITRKLQISCNCFGANTKPVSQIDILRNSGLVLCACTGFIAQSFTNDAQRNLDFVEWLLIGIGSGLFVMVWLQLGDIVQLFYQS